MASTPVRRTDAIVKQIAPQHVSTSNAASPFAAERAAAQFPVREMTFYLDGGERVTQIKELVASSIGEDDVLNDRDRYDQTRPQARERTMAKIVQVVQMIRGRVEDEAEQAAEAAASGKAAESGPSDSADRSSSRAGAGKIFEDSFWNCLGAIDPSWAIRIGVHFGLFQGALMGSGSDEQIAQYARDVQEMRIIGCFAMTEMGHGSFLQGLETTATFDRDAQEFVIHTPTLTATKWWIGMAGESATHAAVYAQLIIDGVRHGIQTFIVPLRCRRSGRPEPGVTLGDMGSKMGRNGLDNGWIQFEHKRVPRTAMLSRWAQVDAAGKFSPPPSKQISYNALLQTRVDLFAACSEVLKKALTISVRYALVRRQSASKGGAKSSGGVPVETLLLDYPTHQSSLFPILAHTFALHFTARHTHSMADAALGALHAQGDREQSDLSALPELHATSSGLKALGTWYANDAIEVCRQSLGGMGYSQYATLAQMRADWAVMATWEGDNTVLSLQCARFLIKQCVSIAQGKAPSGVTKYLADYDSKRRAAAGGAQVAQQQASEPAWLDPAWQLQALQHRAARKVREVTRLLDQESKSANISYAAAFERLSAQCVVVSRLHCYAYMLQCFSEGVAKAPKELQPVLALLRDVFVLHHMESTMGDFLEDGFLTGAHAASLRALLRQLLQRLRPHALPLIDSFNLPDFVVDSPLGRYDGDVYTAMFDAVRAAPNCQGVPAYFDRLIRPLTDPEYKAPVAKL